MPAPEAAARCSASAPSPSETSIIAVAPAAASARPAAIRGRGSSCLALAASAAPPGIPLRELGMFEQHQPGRGAAERPGDADRVARLGAGATDHVAGRRRPADRGHRHGEDGRAGQIAAEQRGPRRLGEVGEPVAELERVVARRSPRGRRARRRARPARRPSPRGRSAPPRRPCGRSLAAGTSSAGTRHRRRPRRRSPPGRPRRVRSTTAASSPIPIRTSAPARRGRRAGRGSPRSGRTRASCASAARSQRDPRDAVDCLEHRHQDRRTDQRPGRGRSPATGSTQIRYQGTM